MLELNQKMMKTSYHSILSVRSDEELYIDVQILIIFGEA